MIIREAIKEDLKYFDIIRGEKLHKLHLKRLKEQNKNKAKYLIIFLNKQPVGHIFIRYKEDRVHKIIPIFEDLFVRSNYRGKGIATKILEHAEKLVKSKGFKECYLDFEIQEKHLEEFYEHRGYIIIGEPSHSYLTLKDNGNKKIKITFWTMKKRLVKDKEFENLNNVEFVK